MAQVFHMNSSSFLVPQNSGLSIVLEGFSILSCYFIIVMFGERSLLSDGQHFFMPNPKTWFSTKQRCRIGLSVDWRVSVTTSTWVWVAKTFWGMVCDLGGKAQCVFITVPCQYYFKTWRWAVFCGICPKGTSKWSFRANFLLKLFKLLF